MVKIVIDYFKKCPKCQSNRNRDSFVIVIDPPLDESCDTFRLVSVSDVKRYSGRVSFFHPLDGSVVTFGGFVITTNDKVRRSYPAGLGFEMCPN